MQPGAADLGPIASSREDQMPPGRFRLGKRRRLAGSILLGGDDGDFVESIVKTVKMRAYAWSEGYWCQRSWHRDQPRHSMITARADPFTIQRMTRSN